MEEHQFKIALVGPENSGKSSLVNSIFGKNISEVSEVGGTTKMPVKKFWGKIKIGKQKINPDFAKITFVDLGGLYAGENRSVVMVGSVLEKTYEEIDDSDLIIHIIDGSTDLFKSFEKLHHLLKFRYRKPIIVVINKCDLIENSKREDLRKYVEGRLENKVFFTSSNTYEGIGELLSTIIEILRRLSVLFKKIKKMISGDSLKTSSPVPIEEYVELPVKGYEGLETIKIKVCDLEDFKDATDIAVLTEAGYLVIANTINLERDLDDDYAKILSSLKEKVGKTGGKIVRLCETKVLAVPSNTTIERMVKEETPKIEEE